MLGLTFPTKVLSDSLGRIGSLKRTSDKSLFPMALGSCGHRITHQLRPINMNGRSILSETSTRLYSVSHWFHKRLEVNVRNPRENRCFQTIIVCSFVSVDNSNKCTVLWKMAVRLITVSTSVNKEMCLMLRFHGGNRHGLSGYFVHLGHAM